MNIAELHQADAALHRLHDLLAERPGSPERLDIATEHRPATNRRLPVTAVTVGDTTVQLQLFMRRSEAQRALSHLTRHQSRPVTIDNAGIVQREFNASPRLERRNSQGFYFHDRHSNASGQSILIEGVTYQCADGAHAAPQTQFGTARSIEYLAVPNPDHTQPAAGHYRTQQFWRIAHNFDAGQAATPEAVANSRLSLIGHQVTCWPAHSILRHIQPQLQASRQLALPYLGFTTPVTPSELDWLTDRPMATLEVWNAGRRSVPLEINDHMAPVRLDPTLRQPIAYSLARELTRRNHRNLVPVADRPDTAQLPIANVTHLSITDHEGNVHQVNPHDPEHYESLAKLRQHRHTAHITFAVSVTANDGTAEHLDIDTDLCAAGRYYEEAVFITEDLEPSAEQLIEDLYSAYWHDSDNPSQEDENRADDYYQHICVLVRRLLHSEDVAFHLELNHLAHRYIQSQPTKVATMSLAANDHILAWLPTLKELDPSLTGAATQPIALALGMAVRQRYPHLAPAEQERIYMAALKAYAARDDLNQALFDLVHQAAAQN